MPTVLSPFWVFSNCSSNFSLFFFITALRLASDLLPFSTALFKAASGVCLPKRSIRNLRKRVLVEFFLGPAGPPFAVLELVLALALTFFLDGDFFVAGVLRTRFFFSGDGASTTSSIISVTFSPSTLASFFWMIGAERTDELTIEIMSSSILSFDTVVCPVELLMYLLCNFIVPFFWKPSSCHLFKDASIDIIQVTSHADI